MVKLDVECLEIGEVEDAEISPIQPSLRKKQVLVVSKLGLNLTPQLDWIIYVNILLSEGNIHVALKYHY